MLWALRWEDQSSAYSLSTEQSRESQPTYLQQPPRSPTRSYQHQQPCRHHSIPPLLPPIKSLLIHMRTLCFLDSHFLCPVMASGMNSAFRLNEFKQYLIWYYVQLIQFIQLLLYTKRSAWLTQINIINRTLLFYRRTFPLKNGGPSVAL